MRSARGPVGQRGSTADSSAGHSTAQARAGHTPTAHTHSPQQQQAPSTDRARPPRPQQPQPQDAFTCITHAHAQHACITHALRRGRAGQGRPLCLLPRRSHILSFGDRRARARATRQQDRPAASARASRQVFTLHRVTSRACARQRTPAPAQSVSEPSRGRQVGAVGLSWGGARPAPPAHRADRPSARTPVLQIHGSARGEARTDAPTPAVARAV
jgi:hypothetical protein